MHAVLVAIVFSAVQNVTALLVFLITESADPTLDVEQWLAQMESNGMVLIAGTLASTLVCVPLLWFLVSRRETDVRRFLRVQGASVRSIASWSMGLVVLAAISDLISLALGRPVVSDFMLEMYATAPPVLLCLALILAAPLFEEIFFRGFLMSALESRGVSVAIGAVVSAALWASIHLQYDLYEMGMIFLMGLLLAAARTSTGSLVPCFVMHGVANVIALSETAFVAEAAVA